MTIDLICIDTKAAFHRTMKNQLDFPEWYGANWDAFWDAIITLVEMPNCLVLQNWEAFAQACPKDMQILREIIDEYHKEMPDKQLLLAS